MKYFLIPVFAFFVGFAQAQNVGIGVPNPLEKLHVNGAIRSDSLTGTPDRIVLADSNGTLQDLAPGNPGEILVSQGNAGPPMWGSLTQSAATIFGTGSLSVTSTTTWTLIPGLSQTLTVAAADKVLIITDGGAQNQSNVAGDATYTDVGIFIDNVQVGSSRRVPALNTSSSIYATGSYSLSLVVTGLSPGPHTISVQARKFSTVFPSAWISANASGSPGPGNPPIRGTLSLIVFK